MALGLIVGIYLTRAQAGRWAAFIAELMERAFSLPAQPLTVNTVYRQGLLLGAQLLWTLSPLLIGVMVTGVLATVAQTRGLVAPALLRPRLSRVSPMTNLRNLFSAQGLMAAFKSILKVLIVGWVAFYGLPQQAERISEAATIGVGPALAVLGEVAYHMSLRCAAMFLVLAVIDYGFQWRQYQQSVRMTREELREEMRSAEGSPEAKAQMRRLQRQWAMQRMMQKVPKADVVVTNPTHMAIALQYEAKTMLAPVVVAKGKGVIARRIVEIARKHRVPVIENRPLAHALIRLEVGTQIPPELYRAVAEVLAFVYRLRRARAA